MGQAGVAHGQQPLQQGVVVLHQRLIVEHRQLQIAVPKPGLGLAGQALGAGFVVIGVGPQPAGVEAAEVAILPLHAQATFSVDTGLDWHQVSWHVDDFQHLFASHRVDA
ncbi:hypothetical protein D3C84_1080880 [compost metagenome]